MNGTTKKSLVETSVSAALANKQINSAYEQMAVSIAKNKIFTMDSGMYCLIEDIASQHKLLQAALGPIADLRASRLLDNLIMPSSSILESMKSLKDYEARFRIPDSAISKSLLESINKPNIAFQAELDKAMSAMRSPWLDMQNTIESFNGFAELQKIGYDLANLRPFDKHLTEILRADLGDWRDAITFPKAIFEDLNERSAFYIERGFNSDLTDFPASAFSESLEVAGIIAEPPYLVERYGLPIPISEDDKIEESLERTNRAHSLFIRFETQIRRFIDEKMTDIFGSEWPKHRLPNGLYDIWQDKKLKAENSGQSAFPIICYADFTDYEQVICRKDNWGQVFQIYFTRIESVRESLQRLYVPRIATMHARPITQDDELFIFVEIKRLGRAIN